MIINAKCAATHKILVENGYPCAPKRAVTYAMFQDGRKSARIAAKSRRDDPLLTVGFNLLSSTQRSGILRLGTQRSECLRSDTLRSCKTPRSSIPLGMHPLRLCVKKI